MDKKKQDKMMCILLISVIIFVILAIIRIKSGPKYNQELIDEINYSYDSMVKNNENIDIYETENIIVVDNKKDDKDKKNPTHMSITIDNKIYKIIGKIVIEKINIEYPIISETTDEYLKLAPTKICGPVINTVGNLCIAGHNYLNGKLFSNLNNLNKGDKVKLIDNNNKLLEYVVYDKYTSDENDVSCLSQDIGFEKEVTLITCINNSSKRLIVKCRAEEF